MKRHLCRVLLAAAVASAMGCPFAVGEREQPRGEGRLPLLKYVEPIYPPVMRFRGVTSGSAMVWLTVDPAGKLIDVYATEYSHGRFAESSIDAIRKWEFAPDPSASRLPRLFSVRFAYSLGGMVVVEVHASDDIAMDRSIPPNKPVFESYPFDDLDSIPDQLTGRLPSYPDALKAEGKSGRVEILFHVDNSGHVRVPMVTYSDDPLFAEAAMDAISKWSFDVPRRRGRPSSAFALQRFTFGPRPESNG
jgi:TonB family protein